MRAVVIPAPPIETTPPTPLPPRVDVRRRALWSLAPLLPSRDARRGRGNWASAPRPRAQDGVHYHFCEKAEMEAMIKRGEFIEYAHVHQNIYGTSIAAVESVRAAGKTCLLDIDVQGAQIVKQTNLDALFLFVAPPSFEELERRLRGRRTESEEKVQVRLETARKELAFLTDPANEGFFNVVIVNENLDEAYAQLKAFLRL